jgi:hypothetical protein
MLNADVLITLGFNPYTPHLTHFQHQAFPRAYEDWMRIDLDYVTACDCVYRLPGHSPGADREVDLAVSLGIPIFTKLGDLLTWRDLKEGR